MPVEIFDQWLRPQSNIFDYATGQKTTGTTESGGRTPVEIFNRWLRPQSNCYPSRIFSTGVEIFRPPVEKRSEQPREVVEQVRLRSKIFDPSRVEAPPPGLGSRPVVVAKVV
ncbi:hypothetical protein TorRG33x02_179540 [Trema orientale]|uniref:Uncharacterized protein n=1 Tax=Trema orientale TaxID=63057 RepID=A0A2P5EL55_TREOI|nr:hypothetical protein TorRG33x02_179540 [Trema orientale]